MHPTPRKTSGFTLVEMLVVAPIAILIITGFIAVMINMVGSVLVSQEQSRIAYDTEQALSQMEVDIHTSPAFLSTTGLVNSPQGSNDSTGAWSSTANGPLVLSTYATTVNPINANGSILGDNSLFYTNQPYGCDDSNHIYNPTYKVYTIYFIKNNNLYRRVIFPNVASTGKPPTVAYQGGDICDEDSDGLGPWQQNSCTNGTGGYCATKDDLVAPNITAMQLTYYPDAGSATPTSDQTSATTVNISLTGSSSASGQSFSYTGVLRTSRANAAS